MIKPREKIGVGMIPRNGKTYLCWHEEHGHTLVFWDMSLCRYTRVEDQYRLIDGIKRYMNDHGQWIEVYEEHKPNPCSKKWTEEQDL